MLLATSGVSRLIAAASLPGQPGASSRPPLAALATRHPGGAASSGSAPAKRCRTAAASRPCAASASPNTDPVGATGGRSIPTPSPALVKNTRTGSTRPAKRRSQPRTVVPGTANPSAIRRHPTPEAAFATNADQMISAEYIRRSRHNTGSSTCVTKHPLHRARRGRTEHHPPGTRTRRDRACPHPPNRPAHPGQLSRPATSSTSTTDPVPMIPPS